MENLRLNSIAGGLLSVVLGFVPDLTTANSVLDFGIKVLTSISVLLIIFVNFKKLRTNAQA